MIAWNEPDTRFSDPPSREVFIEAYRASYSGGEPPWSPWIGIHDPASVEVCPQPSEDAVLERMLEISE